MSPSSSRSYISSSGSSEWCTSSISANRSPTSANRAGMVSTVKSSGVTSATSSHSSGADTGAPGLARIEYGEAIVRSRAFWL